MGGRAVVWGAVWGNEAVGFGMASWLCALLWNLGHGLSGSSEK